MQPFEPELPWKTFSLAVAEADIPRLHEILANISLQQLASLRVGGCWGW
jgi:hypothetical protein